MPELPEVETVCRGLAKVLAGRRIAAVATHRRDLRKPFPRGLAQLRGDVVSVTRRAKYALINLSGGKTLVIHLGMTGRLLFYGADEKYAKGKHDHMVVTMDNGLRMVFSDPRRFGLVDLVDTAAIDAHPLFAHLGPEPFDKKFSATYMAARFKNRKTAIKVAIMDQEVVVGVGNIYAAEALFSARIDPRLPAGDVPRAGLTRLATAIRKTLEKAIAAGGSSLRDYVQTDGTLGLFQHNFAVYDRAGGKCKGCTCNVKKTGGVQRIVQGGRSTFYCPARQGGG